MINISNPDITFRIQTGLPQESRDIRKTVFVDEEGFSDEFEDQDSVAWHIILFYKSQPIGNSRILKEGVNIGHIGRCAIVKEFRKQGFGKILMQITEEECLKYKLTYLYLNAQYDKVGFYEKCGYQKSNKPEFLDQGYPHYEMYKKIAI